MDLGVRLWSGGCMVWGGFGLSLAFEHLVPVRGALS